jgi:hypothetical protein
MYNTLVGRFDAVFKVNIIFNLGKLSPRSIAYPCIPNYEELARCPLLKNEPSMS